LVLTFYDFFNNEIDKDHFNYLDAIDEDDPDCIITRVRGLKYLKIEAIDVDEDDNLILKIADEKWVFLIPGIILLATMSLTSVAIPLVVCW